MPQEPADTPSERLRSRLLVSGRVQGVGFRWFTGRAARARGLSGWVRNLPDGRVEIEVEGEPGALEDFVKAVRQGPPGARVQGLDRAERPTEGAHGFDIRH